MPLSTRLIVLFIAIVLCGAAGGQNEMSKEPYCVVVPVKTVVEVHVLLKGAREDMQWPDLKDTKHLDRAMERIDQADNWLHSFTANPCPAGGPK
jgi:hypothetical protein